MLQLNMIRYKMNLKEATQSFFNRSPHLQGKLNEINREQNTIANNMLLRISNGYYKRTRRYNYYQKKIL